MSIKIIFRPNFPNLCIQEMWRPRVYELFLSSNIDITDIKTNWCLLVSDWEVLLVES